MLRANVGQGCLDLIAGRTYLEIGVNRGLTFHDIQAARKIAVDPQFLFDVQEARIANPHCEYHALPSDEYFLSCAKGTVFDVAFIDGLHTFEQTLRDLMNVTGLMNPGGIIVIDDVMPTSYAASLPSIADSERLKGRLGDTDQSWMGDVYKLVWFIDSFMPAYTYRCVAENHGQLVMWRKHRPVGRGGNRLVSEIGSLSFADMNFDLDVFNVRPFAAILEEIRADLNPAADQETGSKRESRFFGLLRRPGS